MLRRFPFQWLYGCYAWVALLTVVTPLTALLAVTPGLERRRYAARGAARLFFLMIGSPVRVEGELPESHDTCVVVANHASYLDGMVLTAALPARFTYLIKHDMASFPLAGFVLRRLGSAFVNRDNSFDRRRITRRLVEAAQRGGALAFFPEGTFREEPGLRPFQLGAFGAAALAELPVVPVVIHGSRRKLPAGAALPAPGPLRVRVLAALHPEHHPTPRELMLAARRRMLEHLDEPDLDTESVSGRDFGVSPGSVSGRVSGAVGAMIPDSRPDTGP